MRKSTIKLFSALIVLSSVSAGPANAQLPSGYYVFLGNKLGEQQPQLLQVEQTGQVNWPGQVSVPVTHPYASRIGSPAVSPSAHRSSGAFESYEYPTIKFKAKPIASVPGGIGQLSTVYVERYSHAKEGDINLRLTLFKVSQPNQLHSVTLVDRDGISAVKIPAIRSAEFHRVAGTSLFEAQIVVSFVHEADYKRVVDCTIE